MERLEGKMMERHSSATVSTKLQKIATLAREAPTMAFTTLAHHIDIEWLHEAYRRTRKDGATGVDRQIAEDYAANLEENLQRLLDRFKSGTYRAPPVRRVHIPKGDGKATRPIGIPTFEDKVLQRAVTMVLEAIYEQDFLDCSFGFRPRRSAHQALQLVRNNLMDTYGGWVVEVDIQSFFDTVEHHHLRDFLDQRVRDGVLRRMIDKWLAAGVLEAGVVTRSQSGTPQGGVLSPLLANVYLHNVLDAWFGREVIPRLRGRVALVRYADDVVICFKHEADARKVMEVLPKRFGRFGVTLHPEKTRLIEFLPPNRGMPAGKSGTFDLLGFRHYWGKNRSGRPVIKAKTTPSRFTRGLRSIYLWCKRNLHVPIAVQHRILVLKIRGHYAYYGITGNFRSLSAFKREAERAWKKWLSRRSQRAHRDWDRFKQLMERYPLPPPRIVHRFHRQRANP